jgi:hypothetical protein
MDLIDEREKTHGPFERTASAYCFLQEAIKAAARESNSAASAPVVTAIDMIAMKLARIIAGNPNEPDHWRDIAGYAELVVRSLEGGK